MTAFAGARVSSAGHYVSGRCVDNSEIEEFLGLEPGWIVQRTGIERRYWVEPNERLTQLASAAGRRALARLDHAPDIGLVLLATSTPDHLLPPSAPLVAENLGLAGAGAIDLTGACSGFIYAYSFADHFVKLQRRAVLIIAANILSRRINIHEKASSVLFADGAGAIVLEPDTDETCGMQGLSLTSDGSYYDLIQIPSGGSVQPFEVGLTPESTKMRLQRGPEIYQRAVMMMRDCSLAALAQAQATIADITRFIPHQANQRMIDSLAKALHCPKMKVATSIQDYGNCSAATIPMTLSLSMQSRPLLRGEKLLMCAAGAGMVGGALVVRA